MTRVEITRERLDAARVCQGSVNDGLSRLGPLPWVFEAWTPMHQAMLLGDSMLRAWWYQAVEKGLIPAHSMAGWDLRGVDLREGDLEDADLRRADLRGALLQEADLTGANLNRANFYRARVAYACLAGADLRGAALSGVRVGDLMNTTWTDAIWCRCTQWPTGMSARAKAIIVDHLEPCCDEDCIPF